MVGWKAGVTDALGPISWRSEAAYSLERSWSIGLVTKAGSPSRVLRSVNARRMASASTCISAGEPNGGRGRNPSMMFRISPMVTPPEEAGGMLMTVYPA